MNYCENTMNVHSGFQKVMQKIELEYGIYKGNN